MHRRLWLIPVITGVLTIVASLVVGLILRRQSAGGGGLDTVIKAGAFILVGAAANGTAACYALGVGLSRKMERRMRPFVWLAAIGVGLVGFVAGGYVAGLTLTLILERDDAIREVSRYDEIRAKIAAAAPDEVLAVLPAHVPNSSQLTRMRAISNSGAIGMILYCKLPIGEAQLIAAEQRKLAAYSFHGYCIGGSFPQGSHGGDAWSKEVLENLVGLPMPDDFESFVRLNGVRTYGLGGGPPTGTGARVLVDEGTGSVIWEMLHHIPQTSKPGNTSTP